MWRYERGLGKVMHTPLVLALLKMEFYGAKANIVSFNWPPFVRTFGQGLWVQIKRGISKQKQVVWPRFCELHLEVVEGTNEKKGPMRRRGQ
jgi:hypothetical protein